MKRRDRGAIVSAIVFALVVNGGPAAAAPFAYITCDSSVSVIDTATDTVVATVSPGTQFFAGAMSPGGAFAYVTNVDDDVVDVIDTATHIVVDSYDLVQGGFIAITPSGDRLYVIDYVNNEIAVVSTVDGQIVDTIPVSAFSRGLAVHPAGTKLYLIDDATPYRVKVISTVTHTVINTIPVGASQSDVVINPAGTRVYVSNFFDGTVSVIDAMSDQVIATITVPGASPGLFHMAVHPDGSKLYVNGFFGAPISVIDTASNTVTGILVGGNGYGLRVNPAGTKLYAPNSNLNTVSVYDTASNLELYQIPVCSGPKGVGDFITGTQSTATTAIVATGTLSLTFGSTPGTMTFDPGPFSVFGTTVDIYAALGGVPMNASVDQLIGMPGGIGLSFSASSSVIPTFSFGGPGLLGTPSAAIGLSVSLNTPLGTVLPSGPFYTLVAALDFVPPLFTGPFTLSAALGANTPVGSNVTVPATARLSLCPFNVGFSTAIDVTFSEITTGGSTLVTNTCHTPESVPPNFQTAVGPYTFYFDISTTAAYTGPITVCGTYPDATNDGVVDLTLVDELTLVILHDDGHDGDFDPPISQTIYPDENRICAVVNSLSPFMLAVNAVDRGVVPTNSDARLCEHRTLKQVVNLTKGILKCNRKAAEAAFKGRVFDSGLCEDGVRAKYDEKIAALSGCPACLLTNAQSLRDATERTVETLSGSMYCAGSTAIGGDDFGYVPPDGGAKSCAKDQAKSTAKLGKRLAKCYRKHVDAVVKNIAFDLDACLIAAANEVDAALAAIGGCASCAVTNAMQMRNPVERLFTDTLGAVYCDGTTPVP